MRKPAWLRNYEMGVPLTGAEAFSQGWAVDACPHPEESIHHRYWISGWWGENAEAFRSHVEDHTGAEP